ncbi:MAG: hypothetical protein PHW12_09330 [Smithella sp.]|nr:hypothetical protein [Smithella sp.]
MQALKTRREFLYDVGALSFVVAFNDTLLNKILSPLHSIGVLDIDRNDWPEEQINICYLGLGSTGMEIGNNLSEYFGTTLQKVNLRQDNWRPFSFSLNSLKDKLEASLQKQSMAVLVSDIDDPIFFDLRKCVISSVPFLWTICMASKTDEKDIFDLHYEPNEILRIARGSSFPYQDTGNFVQSILAIYQVQASLKHNDDFQDIWMEALKDLGES